jgi:hypothetical protein
MAEKVMNVNLTPGEIAELDKQDPATARDGGFQSLMVSLQNRVNRKTGSIRLTPKDLERIPKYAFDFRKGGWEDRLKRTFGRTLGPKLGR